VKLKNIDGEDGEDIEKRGRCPKKGVRKDESKEHRWRGWKG
jgi:hypothetical protein